MVLNIYNTDSRIVTGFGSVEVRDRQGDILPISEFRKIMPVIMDRGGSIMASHTNKHIGKILNYEFKEHPETKTEGVFLTVKVFDDYPIDDEIWNGIKEDKFTGFSFGGAGEVKDIIFNEDTLTSTKVLDNLQGYEFSIVEKPANQLSTFDEINMLAKEDIQKPFGKYENMADCVEQNKTKENPEAYCAIIMRAIEGKEDKLTKDLTNNMDLLDEINKTLKEILAIQRSRPAFFRGRMGANSTE